MAIKIKIYTSVQKVWLISCQFMIQTLSITQDDMNKPELPIN